MIKTLRSDDLIAGEAANTRLVRLEVDGEDILLARLASGRVVAFAGFCPHQMTDLADATIWDGKVRCPRHNYLYDPSDGANVLPCRDARPENLWKLLPGYLPCYPVEERDGWVWVDPKPMPPPVSYNPALEEPPPVGSNQAAASVAPRPPPVEPGFVEHDTEHITMAADSTVELSITTTVRPGFMWRIEAPSPLAVVEERFQPGDPPVHRVKLAASATGSGDATVRCTYARPWDREPAEVRIYVVTVNPA